MLIKIKKIGSGFFRLANPCKYSYRLLDSDQKDRFSFLAHMSVFFGGLDPFLRFLYARQHIHQVSTCFYQFLRSENENSTANMMIMVRSCDWQHEAWVPSTLYKEIARGDKFNRHLFCQINFIAWTPSWQPYNNILLWGKRHRHNRKELSTWYWVLSDFGVVFLILPCLFMIFTACFRVVRTQSPSQSTIFCNEMFHYALGLEFKKLCFADIIKIVMSLLQVYKNRCNSAATERIGNICYINAKRSAINFIVLAKLKWRMHFISFHNIIWQTMDWKIAKLST